MKIQDRLKRAFNPVSIAVMIMLLLVLTVSLRIGIPFEAPVKWLFLPSFQECRNFGGNLFNISFVITYMLMLATTAFIGLVIESETEKQYIAYSVIGVIVTLAWFGWGIIIFLLCGLRPH